jgi:hypothetical protein
MKQGVEDSMSGRTITGVGGWPTPDTLKCPGLTPEAPEMMKRARELPKKLAVFSYKEGNGCLWIALLGGTGTGKSTLFNLICGDSLSATGVERPKTTGPVAYAHRECDIEDGFPFASIAIERTSAVADASRPVTGSPGHLVVLEHERDDFVHLIWVDAPDVDSVAERNREIAADLCLLADVIVFVTSQEKYADEIPSKVLGRMIRDERSCFLVVNKVQPGFGKADVIELLRGQEIVVAENRTWALPRAPSAPAEWLSEDSSFRAFFADLLTELATEAASERRTMEQVRLGRKLGEELAALTGLLRAEDLAAQEWLARLSALYDQTTQGFLANEKDRFSERSRDYLKAEIRKLFAKYDVLARPRRAIQQIVLTPLRLLGLWREGNRDRHRKALLTVGHRVEVRPIRECIERFNRLVLEDLSPPSEEAPLFEALRRPGIPLRDQEIEGSLRDNQVKLAEWLEDRFEGLSHSMPPGKKWGMYSTSVLWGIIILAFETTVGGGFTVLDAALDSALAPFVTKGAVELFAYREIQKIARQLARRYQEGLLTIFELQRSRYEACLRSLLTPKEAQEQIDTLRKEFQGRTVAPTS